MTTGRRPSSPPQIPGYTVGRLLGMGGFADVFLYTQHLPRRPVAVKVVPAESLDADVLARFGTEADLMAQLSHHPSIVTIHHAAVADDGRPYLVMEYCARPGLGARYRTERISVAEALRIGIRLASAVETAHRAGILHRDIKPANVLTTDFGWPALTDFGIAATTGWSGGCAVGMSIPWSPPELLAAVPDGDVRADVYSLAATVYSLLAGRSPFEVPGGSNGAADLVARIERQPLAGTGRTDVPPSLEAALARAMEKNPVHRFHSALALARALQAVELELMLPGTPVELAQEGAEPRTDPAAGVRAPERADDGPTRLRPVVTIDPEGDPADGPAPAPAGPVRTAAEEAATVTRRRPVASISPEGATPAGTATVTATVTAAVTAAALPTFAVPAAAAPPTEPGDDAAAVGGPVPGRTGAHRALTALAAVVVLGAAAGAAPRGGAPVPPPGEDPPPPVCRTAPAPGGGGGPGRQGGGPAGRGGARPGGGG
uniref:serine/threonine-protein kinase n=1 Tax=uncultured Cellulomonas sp. TaxID=189682 RepID=UPI00262CC4B5